MNKIIKFLINEKQKNDFYIAAKNDTIIKYFNDNPSICFEKISARFVNSLLIVCNLRDKVDSSEYYIFSVAKGEKIVSHNFSGIFKIGSDISYSYFTRNELSIISRFHIDKYNDRFINKIEELRRNLDLNGICEENIVITNGSALEACGIRNSGDTDIIICSSERKKLGTDKRIHLSDNIEIKAKDNYALPDDDLIFSDTKHFISLGMKFLNPEYCLRNSCKRIYKKHDRKDAILISLFLLRKGHV